MSPISHQALIVRILIGAALGAVIGYERDRHGRPVGLRTHLLVSMTAATFMVVSTQFVYWQHYGKDDLIAVDPSRIAASVVSGIGFLAGGAILRTGASIQGLTTAAGLWLVTAIGLCAGAGMFIESSIVTFFGVVALTVLRRFEDKNDLVVRRRVSIVLGEGNEGISKVVEALTSMGVVVQDIEYEKRFDEKRRITATFEVQIPSSMGAAPLVERLEALPGVRRVQVQQVP
jgi:putative Mg2+ transporter-C (MgtC) family protein